MICPGSKQTQRPLRQRAAPRAAPRARASLPGGRRRADRVPRTALDRGRAGVAPPARPSGSAPGGARGVRTLGPYRRAADLHSRRARALAVARVGPRRHADAEKLVERHAIAHDARRDALTADRPARIPRGAFRAPERRAARRHDGEEGPVRVDRAVAQPCRRTPSPAVAAASVTGPAGQQRSARERGGSDCDQRREPGTHHGSPSLASSTSRIAATTTSGSSSAIG